MGESGENCKGCNMLHQVVYTSLVLFQFSHPTHNVAVFRGADLKKAIAAGVVKGFGSLGGDSDAASSGQENRDGRSDDGEDGGNYAAPTTAAPPPPTTTTPPPPPPTTQAYVAPTTVAPVYKPAPVVYRPA